MADEYTNTFRELRTHFKEYWEARVPTVPLIFDNEKPLKPAPDPDSGEWIEAWVLYTTNDIMVIGGRESRLRGRFFVKIYTPRSKGAGRAMSYIDTIADIWDSAHLNGLDGSINLEATKSMPGGMDPQLQFRVGIAETGFYVTHIPT
jgi:hypothetical protein